MTKKTRQNVIILLMLLVVISIVGFSFKEEASAWLKFYVVKKVEPVVLKRSKFNFRLRDTEQVKLINSAIKQNYSILFDGKIVKFDSLIIGKGLNAYLSSYILIKRDSIIVNHITNRSTRKAYKHGFKLINNLSINIKREEDSTIVTIANEADTLKISSDFVGMNNPYICSSGSTIDIKRFEFACNDYYSDVFVFGDSYVNRSNPDRWPYHLYKEGYKFLCDGLPGGKSIDSYSFLKSAISVHKPKYLIWCLGMNDGSDKLGTNPSWKYYFKKVMNLCSKHNITLILATVPSVPTRDNSGKSNFVRKSGFRYIDFDNAVSDQKGIWKKGMLSSDGVHPTELGAREMKEELLKSFPEIRNAR